MPNLKNNIQRLWESPWFMALILLGIFFIITDYKYGWDDQNLEIPLLKHLIDPALFQGDYYVESLKKNFSSYFYPILARMITIEQIPAAYFSLYVISRYFLLFWLYKLWLHISGRAFDAFCCVLVFIFMTRVQEFVYRTFSHQEFALAFIFAGIYFFFRERFILAAIVLGLTANFHALYSLFPMIFMQIYLLWQIKRHGFKTIVLSCAGFVICSLPFIFWILRNRLTENTAASTLADPDWLSLFILACPQNFFFPEFPLIPFERLISTSTIFLHFTERYIVLIVIFLFNFLFNKHFKNNKKAIAFTLSAFGLMIVSLVFTYIYPSRFVIDLNLIRNSQFILFLLMGFTTIKVIETVQEQRALVGFAMMLLFTFLKYGELISILALITMGSVLLLLKALKEKGLKHNLLLTISVVGILYGVYWLTHYLYTIEFTYMIRRNLSLIFLLLTLTYLAHYFVRNHQLLKKLFILIPLTVFLYQYGYYHQQQVKTEREGLTPFWRLQSSWEDMQKFVKLNTAKEAIVFIPYNMEMGGFRIGSERKVVVCYRDCGIIGFDYAAAQEWRRRINDIKPYKVVLEGPATAAIKTAISKYKADYIVFMRYAAPRDDRGKLLERIYTNDDFVLFKVNLQN